MPVLNPEAVISALVDGLRDHMKEACVDHLTVAVSGGVDSALSLCLAARAAGPGNVVAVYIDIDSSADSRRRARLVAEVCGVTLIEVSATKEFSRMAMMLRHDIGSFTDQDNAMTEAREQVDLTILGSLRSTFRTPIIDYMNRVCGKGAGLIVGTGNECEDRVFRYYNKRGDGAVDCNPAANLSKGEVRQVALAIGVPLEVVLATPTADLWGCGDTQSDEVELTQSSGGLSWTYSTIDESGNYTGLGTIELISRLDDQHGIFTPAFDVDTFDLDIALLSMGLPPDVITRGHIISARAWEHSTQHKDMGTRTYLNRYLLNTNGAITDSVARLPVNTVRYSDTDKPVEMAVDSMNVVDLAPNTPVLGLGDVQGLSADLSFTDDDDDDDDASWQAARMTDEDEVVAAVVQRAAPSDDDEVEDFQTPGIDGLVDEMDGRETYADRVARRKKAGGPDRSTFAERSAKRKQAAVESLQAEVQARTAQAPSPDVDIPDVDIPAEGDSVNALVIDTAKAGLTLAGRAAFMVAKSIISGKE